MSESDPHYASGKICYVEIPASDVAESAAFYERVFGWAIRERGDGAMAFDDTVGAVSGTWVVGRPPASDPKLLVYVMVADAAGAVDRVIAAGGSIVRPVDPSAHEIFAWFSDPFGNVLGIYQQRGLAQSEG